MYNPDWQANRNVNISNRFESYTVPSDLQSTIQCDLDDKTQALHMSANFHASTQKQHLLTTS